MKTLYKIRPASGKNPRVDQIRRHLPDAACLEWDGELKTYVVDGEGCYIISSSDADTVDTSGIRKLIKSHGFEIVSEG